MRPYVYILLAVYILTPLDVSMHNDAWHCAFQGDSMYTDSLLTVSMYTYCRVITSSYLFKPRNRALKSREGNHRCHKNNNCCMTSAAASVYNR
eukprot:scaffold311682_cov26-Prasinocladus_malaysianus.AAC.1